MKLLYLAQSFWPTIGGVEISHKLVLEALVSSGDQVTVLTSPYEGAPEAEQIGGITIRRFPFRQAMEAADPNAIARGIAVVAKLKREFQPDLVHVALTDPIGFFHLRSFAAWPSATVTSVHVSIARLQGGQSGSFGKLLEQSEVIVANSDTTRAELAAMFPALTDRLHRVWPASGTAKPVAARSGDARPRLLFAGRMVPEKGAATLIAAMPAILSSIPELELFLVGDGAERPLLEAAAARAGISAACHFLGMVPNEEIGGLLGQADLVVVPSLWKEAFGLVAAEAALTGRPVVASRIGGLQEVVADGETGLLFEPGDPQSLAAAVLKIMLSPDRGKELGDKARQRAEREFSLAALISGYRRAHATALASSRHKSRA